MKLLFIGLIIFSFIGPVQASSLGPRSVELVQKDDLFGENSLQRLRELRDTRYRDIQDQKQRFFNLMSDSSKLTGFAQSLGALLEHRIVNDQLIAGHELNLMAATLSAFLNLTDESIRMQNDFRLKRSIRESAPLFTSSGHYSDDLMELHILRTRIENTHLIFSTFFTQKILRIAIRDQSKWEGYGISDIESKVKEVLDSDRVSSLTLIYQSLIRVQRELLAHKNPFIKEYTGLVLESGSYQYYLLGDGLDVYSDLNSIIVRTSDNISRTLSGLTRVVSKGFGTVAGNIKWRSGRLKDNTELEAKMLEVLKPLDLIFEKKRFLLTDKTIPGHWGHVGVWIGSEQQWRELGLWDHEELGFFQKQIEKGNQIFEVRRWGMEFNSVENFINLDEIAALRVRPVIGNGRSKIIDVLKSLESQMGKRYDFGFDAMATDRIICTELMTLSYGPINWPFDRRAGRYTITPDNMAELLYYQDSPIEFVFYGKGDRDKNYISLSKRDFARELGYFQHKISGEFHEKTHHCEVDLVRRRSSLRVLRNCNDEFHRHVYEYDITPSPSTMTY